MSTDNTAPTASRHTPVVIVSILVVLLLLVVAALFGGRSWGDGRAEDYASDFAAWQEKDGATLVADTSKVPSGTYLLEDMHTTKAVATQRRGCAEVEAVAKRARTSADDLPTVSAGPVGLVSSKVGDAADDSTRREKAVAAYARKAAAAYEQIHVDCSWNLVVNTPTQSSKKSAALYKKAAKYLDPEGPMIGGTCNNKDGCISNVKAKRIKYADIREQAYRLDQKQWDRMYAAGCAKTSYGKKMCDSFRTGNTRYADVRLEQAEVVRSISSSIDSKEIVDVNAKWAEVQRLNLLSSQKMLKKEHPEAAEDKRVREYPAFTDRFLLLEARRLVAGLAKDRAAIARL
jgi:hypothetical protein